MSRQAPPNYEWTGSVMFALKTESINPPSLPKVSLFLSRELSLSYDLNFKLFLPVAHRNDDGDIFADTALRACIVPHDTCDIN